MNRTNILVEDGPLSSCVCCGAGLGSQISIFIAVGVHVLGCADVLQEDATDYFLSSMLEI
jgi:hypothetical protein